MFTAYLLGNRHLLFLSVIVLLAAGASGFLSLPRLEDPRIVTRNAMVLTTLPGASAERVEALVTEKIEEKLQEVAEVKHLTSISRAGISLITIELEDAVGANENEAIFSRIRDKLAEAEVLLPPEASKPVYDDQRFISAFTLIVALKWDQQTDPKMNILRRHAEALADRMRNVSGTEYVRLYGAPDEEITATVDPRELTRLGLTIGDVARVSASADPKVPAGVIRGPETSYLAEVTGELDSLARVGGIRLKSDGGSVVRLGDVADLQRRWRDPPTEIGVTQGTRCIYVAALAQGNTQVDVWADQSRTVIDEYRHRVGSGVGVEVIFDQSVYTVDRLRELSGNLFAGAMVIMAVVLIMMGWRASLLVGMALPLAVSFALFGFTLIDGSLHQMSIFGLIIALGLLIDNAIVVVDEIRSRCEKGMRPGEAAIDAVQHLGSPLMASTLTTCLAFAPIMLLPGSAGDFVGMIGSGVVLAILGSFLVSMTLIAVLAGLYGKFGGRADSWWQRGVSFNRGHQWARRLLLRAMRRPRIAMALACVPALVGFALFPTMGNQFFPLTDRDMFEVKVWMPRETSIDQTRATSEEIERVIREESSIHEVHWLVGGSFPAVYYNQLMDQDAAPHFAQAVLKAESAESVKWLVPRLQRTLDDRFPGAQIVVQQFGQGPPVDAGVQFRLYGNSIDELRRVGDQMRAMLQEHPDVIHTQVTMPGGEPKLWFDAHPDLVRLANMTLTGAAEQLQGSLEGVTGGSVLEQLDELPVRIRYPDANRRDAGDLASIEFVNDTGEPVPLSGLGELHLRPSLAEISRFDGLRCNIIKGYTRNGALPIDVATGVRAAIDRDDLLPMGFQIELGGAAEQESDAVQNLMTYAPVLVTLTIATVILAFRSVAMAAILGMVALMSVGLGLMATGVYGLPFSFNTILGTLGLMGVALNDSIVVLAGIRSDPQARAGEHRAVVRETLGSMRHVFSTTLTTIGGFLPLLLFVGGDFWPALAIVLAGGVGGATILALVFIPSAYVLVIRWTGAPTPLADGGH